MRCHNYRRPTNGHRITTKIWPNICSLAGVVFGRIIKILKPSNEATMFTHDGNKGNALHHGMVFRNMTCHSYSLEKPNVRLVLFYISYFSLLVELVWIIFFCPRTEFSEWAETVWIVESTAFFFSHSFKLNSNYGFFYITYSLLEWVWKRELDVDTKGPFFDLRLLRSFAGFSMRVCWHDSHTHTQAK